MALIKAIKVDTPHGIYVGMNSDKLCKNMEGNSNDAINDLDSSSSCGAHFD